MGEQKDKKLAIIENEFGEISIDDELLKQEKLAMAEKIIVMDNGCMCCTIRGDLENGLTQIIDDIKKGSKIDGIMIETTGMADPVPIVRTFMTNQQLTRELRLDAVIAMADAKHIIGRLDDNVEEGKVNEAYQQVAFSDKIILNKLDLITPEAAISVKDRIRSINKFAKIVPAVRGRVKMTELTTRTARRSMATVDMVMAIVATVATVTTKMAMLRIRNGAMDMAMTHLPRKAGMTPVSTHSQLLGRARLFHNASACGCKRLASFRLKEGPSSASRQSWR